MKRGKFVVIEGIDRAGKSTQCKLIQEKLGWKVIEFPNRSTPTGKLIDAHLKREVRFSNETFHLLCSANRWEMMAEIKELLLFGTNIICGRYAYSGVAYSHAKGMDFDWCKNPDIGLIKPDLVIFLDVGAEVAASRGDFGKEIYEKIDFQKKVRKSFLKVLDILDFEGFKLVHGSTSIDRDHETIMDLLEHMKEPKELKELWK